MYCPKGGRAEQVPETYCRQCGVFLPDLLTSTKSKQTPEDHVTANLLLNALTVFTCFTLAILLYVFVAFRDDTHPLIYATAGLLIAMGCWHTQTLWRSILLKRHFKKLRRDDENPAELPLRSAETNKRLYEPDLGSVIPASIAEGTTRHLDETKLRSS